MTKNYFKLKKRHTAFYCLVTGLLFSLNTQAQSWQWGKSGGSFDDVQNNEEITSVVTDAEGNNYLLATVGVNGLQIDGVNKEAYDDKDYAIASFTCNGVYRWSKIIGGEGNDRIQRLQTDAEGNIYAVGKISRTSEAYFGGETDFDLVLPSTSSTQDTEKQNLFLVKYSPEGTLLWIRFPQPENISFVDALANSHSMDFQVDPEGNSYWLCLVPPGVYGGEYNNETEGNNMLIFKYDSEGNFTGAHPIDFNTSGSYPYLKMVHNPTSGNYYIAGSLPITVTPPTINGTAVENTMFIAGFNNTGDFIWKHENNNDEVGQINDICLDNSGNIYVTGKTNSDDTMAGEFIGPDNNSNGQYPVLIKFNGSGDIQWVKNTENSAGYPATAVTINGSEVAIAGYENGVQWGDYTYETEDNRGSDAYFTRFNKENGDIIAMHKVTSVFGAFDYGTTLTADSYGNYYLGGRFDAELYVGDDTLTENAQGWDFFLAKYGSNNCDCELPTPSFGYAPQGENTGVIDFTYTGSTTYDSISWNFGNGDTSTEESPIYTYSEGGTYNVCVTVTNSCGSEQYCTDVEPTLLNDSFSKTGVDIYPNPVTDVFTITTEKELNYTIYTALGSKILSGITTGKQTTINTGNLASGWYLLTLTSNSGSSKTIKLIKE